MKRLTAICLFLGLFFLNYGQSLTGKVFQIGERGDTTAMPYATVQWLKTTIGAQTDTDGKFTIPRTRTDTLVISFPKASFCLFLSCGFCHL